MLSESKTHWDLKVHSLENLFKQIKINHFRSHTQMNFWFKIKKKNSTVKKQQVLNCMWVYIYKFTKKRMLTKCKTCLIMWDDQQVKSDSVSIYTVTLAAHFFHVFMTLAAQFDLKLIQYNTVNIFMHANLNEIIFMKMSDEYQKTDHILRLNKTLYELQRFSLYDSRSWKRFC